MALRLSIAALLAVLYVWVIVATWPYRLSVIQQEKEKDYYETLERQVNYAKAQFETLKSSTTANPDEKLDAQERYALFLWEKKEFVPSMELFQDLVAKRKPKDGDPYNEKWVQSMMRLAGIYRDMSNWTPAESTYNEVLDYDKKFFEKDDPNNQKIGRDLNNLGLLNYMIATGEKEDPKRQELMKKSSGLLNDAIKVYQAKLGQQSPSEGISLWNLYLVERDLGNEKLSQEIRARAEAIDNKMNRPVKAP